MMGLGTFAEAMRVNARSVVKVETDLPDEVLALIGCGVTTGVGAALNTGAVRAGSTVAVIGCGGVGMSAVQGSRAAGAARIIVVDPVEAKRAAATTLGATDVIDPGSGDVVSAVLDLTSGRGVDVAIDAVGYAATVAQACAMTRKAGTAVIVGMGGLAQDLGTVPLGGFVFNEKRIVGSLYGSAEVRRDFARCVELIESGGLDIAQLVSKRVGLEDVNGVLGSMESGDAIRTVITF
jgi:S-(hydroxymethyl)glutathione dehydrogenase/alcohol dehydrogenase